MPAHNDRFLWSRDAESMLLPRPSARRPSTQPLTRLERMYEKLLEPTMLKTVTAVEERKEMRTTLPPLTPTCHRVLDCPGLPDEFYITPLDRWGEFVAIGLQDTVYLYSFASNSIVHTIPVAPCIQGGAATDDGVDDGVGDSHYVSSVKFIEDGSRVIAGTSSGHLCMYDVSTGSVCSSVRLCDLRINIMAWNANKKKLSVGGGRRWLIPVVRRFSKPFLHLVQDAPVHGPWHFVGVWGALECGRNAPCHVGRRRPRACV